MQPQSQMEEMGYNDLCYGWDCNHMLPTFMNPNEVLDGAMISGSFMPCSSKWATYDFQNCPVIKRLYKEHGKTLNFLGVIMSNLNVALEQKERSALFVAQIAKSLGADAALVTEAVTITLFPYSCTDSEIVPPKGVYLKALDNKL